MKVIRLQLLVLIMREGCGKKQDWLINLEEISVSLCCMYSQTRFFFMKISGTMLYLLLFYSYDSPHTLLLTHTADISQNGCFMVSQRLTIHLFQHSSLFKVRKNECHALPPLSYSCYIDVTVLQWSMPFFTTNVGLFTTWYKHGNSRWLNLFTLHFNFFIFSQFLSYLLCCYNSFCQSYYQTFTVI